MSAENLIERLDGVREIGAGRWIAKCPSHEDRSPSLSIRETEDGTILLHDFAGCLAADIIASIGLEFGDLFPARHVGDKRSPIRPNHWHAAREALRVLATESLIVAIAGENIANGIALSDDDRDRVLLAANRIRAAREACQ